MPVPEARISREIKAFFYLLKIKKKQNLVICATWYPEAFLCSMVGVEYVILAHGTEIMLTKNFMKRLIWEPLKRVILRNAKYVIANSHFTAKLVLAVEPRVKVIALPLAVDIDKFFPGNPEAAKVKLGVSGKKVISTVSRVLRYKGHETVFSALKKLELQQLEQIVYLVVGTGPYLESLKQLAKRLQIEKYVRFMGSVADEERLLVYQASNLFLLCSWEEKEEQNVEGFGLVLLEAAACGAAVLGTDSGGIPDAVNESHGGILIPERGVDELAAHLRSLVENPEIARFSGKRLTEFVRSECTWEKYATRFLNEIHHE